MQDLSNPSLSSTQTQRSRLISLCMHTMYVFHSLHLNSFLFVVSSVVLLMIWPNNCVYIKLLVVSCVCVCACACNGGGWYLQWILNLWLPPNPTPPRPATQTEPEQNRADKAAPFNLSQMCSPAPVCRGNCEGGNEGMKGGLHAKCYPTHIDVQKF